MLMFGVFISAPWLIPALATGGALLLLYLFVKEIYGDIHPGIALIAAGARAHFASNTWDGFRRGSANR